MNVLTDKKLHLGESPIWNYHNESIDMVDIIDDKIIRYYDHAMIEHKLDKKPTSIGLMDTNKSFISVSDGAGIYDFRDNSYHSIYEINLPGNIRLNDGKCDRYGNYWVGSMDINEKEKVGKLYKFTDNILVQDEYINNLGGIGIFNGLCWDKYDKIYYADSLEREIYCADYDNNNLCISNSEIIFKSEDEKVTPDGCTASSNNILYSCLWGGSCVYSFDKYSDKMKLYKVNAKYPTCCCFGGENLDTLFVTSAMNGDNEKDSGKVFYQKINEDFGIKECSVNFC